MLNISDEELEKYHIDPDKMRSITRRLRKISKELSRSGVSIFGSSGTGLLRFLDSSEKICIDIAHIGFGFDGGDSTADDIMRKNGWEERHHDD